MGACVHARTHARAQAAARNNRTCVEYLLSLSDAVDKYRLDNYGHSARDCALARNYADVAELLL